MWVKYTIWWREYAVKKYRARDRTYFENKVDHINVRNLILAV